MESRKVLIALAVVGLIMLLAGEMWFSVLNKSQTYDEAAHLYAGYSYWTRADFSISPEHPPLARLVASLPLLPLKLKVPPVPNGSFDSRMFQGGRNFLYANDADVLLFRARMAVSVFTLALALLVFAAGAEMFGSIAGLFALILLVFEPNILANGPLVCTDAAVTCCFFAAVYAFYRYARKVTIARLALCGLAAGLTLGTKCSGIILFPILVLLAGWEIFRNRHSGIGRQILLWVGSLGVIGIIAVVLLWSFYGFHFGAHSSEFNITPLLLPTAREHLLPESYLYGPATALRWYLLNGLTAAVRWHLLPESYVYGLAFVISDTQVGRATFLMGKLYGEGQWFFFPLVFVIKSTLGFLALLTFLVCAGDIRRPSLRRELIYLGVPAMFFFAICLTSKLDMGLRHLLPMYPFLIVLAGAGASSLAQSSRLWAWTVGGFLMLHVASSARAFPDYLAYSNEIWGGPANTYRVLAGSDTDWGGGLKEVQQYVVDHDITQCWFAYFGPVDPAYYHIPCRGLSTTTPYELSVEKSRSAPGEIDGPVFVSVSTYDFSAYEVFLQLHPTTVLDGSILVYEGHFAVDLSHSVERPRL